MTTALQSFTVVIPTRDRPEQLRACLAALLPGLSAGDECIVVDSASTDPMVREVASQGEVRYLRCDRPGVNVARNAGWRAAGADLIAFIDDDVRVADDWASSIRSVAASHPAVAFFPGRVAVPPEHLFVERAVATKDDDRPAVLGPQSRGDLGHSANLVVRRSALERVGGFDDQMGVGSRFKSAPELDLFDRLFAEGLMGRFSPELRAWHEQWRGRDQLLRLDWRYGYGAGARLSKLVRADPRRSWVMAVDFFWSWCACELWRSMRARHKFVALAAGVRIVAAVGGFTRALFVPVDRGHFRSR
jgi:glycosyltransferase involved in cell wall biosynthesis